MHLRLKVIMVYLALRNMNVTNIISNEVEEVKILVLTIYHQ